MKTSYIIIAVIVLIVLYYWYQQKNAPAPIGPGSPTSKPAPTTNAPAPPITGPIFNAGNNVLPYVTTQTPVGKIFVGGSASNIYQAGVSTPANGLQIRNLMV